MLRIRSKRAGIFLAIGVAIGAASGHAASPYDGTWTAQRHTGCGGGGGRHLALTVTDGIVTVSNHGGGFYFVPSKIASDGKVILMATSFGKADLPPLYVTFAGDHFEAHRNADCGYFTITGVRTSH
jgi:hypothetical protein